MLWDPRLPGAMVARLASIAQRYQKVAGSSPAVVITIIFTIPHYFSQLTDTVALVDLHKG